MRERSEQALRILCYILAGLLVFQLALRVVRRDPLAKLTIPPLPALTNTTETAAGKNTSAPGPVGTKNGTNLVATKTADKGIPSTNGASLKGATNFVRNEASATGTNVATPQVLSSVHLLTNAVAQYRSSTTLRRGTNALAAVPATDPTNQLGPTNALASAAPTNALRTKTGTNLLAHAEPGGKSTNRITAPNAAMLAMGPGGASGPSKPKALPPAIQARVDRIVESELLGPVMRPLPMGLLGIAGDVAFLRGPSGQTGLVKVGDKLGELKLLEIGINRVLIEQDGEKKELTMFSGYGSESLLPKTQDNSR